MYIEQLYTGCISEAAYYIESNGEAAIIDPLRDIEAYLLLAKERNATIRFIFETHFHADFISGHLDLSKATGAPIVYGPGTQAGFDITIAADNQEFIIGDITIQAIHTPGHTLESTCYLLKTKQAQPHALFTGDTLFVGDVGRPDVAQQGDALTAEDLAGMLYDSLHQKIVTLPDNVLVYPAHGQGSSCGKNLSANRYSTIGDEKESNYALQLQSKEAFVKAVTKGLAAPPQYFAVNAQINKEGYEALDAVIAKGMTALNVADVKHAMEHEGSLLLDTREVDQFVHGFVPGAISIGLEGRFAEWAGSLLPFDKNLLLITEPGKEKETIIRLARVGFEKFKGFLEGGFAAWQEAGEPIDMIINVDADEVAMDIPFDENLVIVDVRKEVEFADGHVKDAVNIPLGNLTDPASMAGINDADNLYLHCGSGYRSVIAASLLKREGIHNLRNITGGYAALKSEPKIAVEKSTEVLN